MARPVAVAVAASVLILAGCGSVSPSTPTAPTPAAASPVGTAAPTAGASAATGELVGISMPADAPVPWSAAGDALVLSLQDLGYTTDLEYAQGDALTQVSQLEAMIEHGARALVIAPVDGTALTGVLQEASDAGVKVLAYDLLIRDSRHVDYFVTFDANKVGELQARSIVDGLGLAREAGPFSIELFGGSPEDPTASSFYAAATSILDPYIERGQLVVRSGETSFPEQIGTLHWDGSTAQARLDVILATSYADGRIDAVLSPSDAISAGVIASLRNAGYYSTRPGPVVTGYEATPAAVKSILAGEQTSTVFADPRSMARQASVMVDELLRGRTVDVSDTGTYQNGARIVPAFVVDVVLVTRDNAEQLLVDSGYYKAEDLR